jgi:hypothetical protein
MHCQPDRVAGRFSVGHLGIRRRTITRCVSFWRSRGLLLDKRFSISHDRNKLFRFLAIFVFENDLIWFALTRCFNDMSTCGCHGHLHWLCVKHIGVGPNCTPADR